MRVAGLGYIAEYFTLDGREVVHASVPHVDPQVRAFAPVWLPHIPPTPLCGLGRGAAERVLVSRTSGPPCRACQDHLRDLDEWVRQAERQIEIALNATGNGNGHSKGHVHANGNGNGHTPAPAQVPQTVNGTRIRF